MKFHIPFTISKLEKLKAKSGFFLTKVRYKKDSKLSKHLENSNIEITREEYLAICYRNLTITFVVLFMVFMSSLILLRVKLFFLFGPLLAASFSMFIFFSQTIYPKIYVTRRQKNIERNLIPALEDILVQLSSGIPLFSVLVNISVSDYGELSVEFKKAVRQINAGAPEQEVLENLSNKNPSIFFKRALWQISNGMEAGGDMSVVVKDSIHALNEEQIIQIQNYGNKLNPLIVFYMLIAVIIPALSITFLTIISSMTGLPELMTTLLFIGLFIFVMLIQVMFLGLIKSKRPSLL
jgi:flagellar protein FlaJ